MFEESFIQASRALSDERRQYIASIVENGLTGDEITYAESKYLMNLLEEINDIEVIWLRYYFDQRGGSDEEFRKKHDEVLKTNLWRNRSKTGNAR